MAESSYLLEEESNVFEALTHHRRQNILDILEAYSRPISLGQLAAELSTQTSHPSEKNGEHVKQIEVALYHWHVPKLEGAGLVDFDPSSKTVSITETAKEISRRNGELQRSIA